MNAPATQLLCSSLTVSADDIAALFPFYLCVNHNLTITSYGRAIAKICPNICSGVPLATMYRMVRPKGDLSVETLVSTRHKSILIEPIEGLSALKSIVLRQKNSFAIIGTPLFAATNMQSASLFASDFAACDPTLEYCAMLQAQHAEMASLRRVNEQLSKEKALSEATNRSLAAEYIATRVMADSRTLGDAFSELVEGLCHAMPLNHIVLWKTHRQNPPSIIACNVGARSEANPNYCIGYKAKPDDFIAGVHNGEFVLEKQGSWQLLAAPIHINRSLWAILQVAIDCNVLGVDAYIECLRHVAVRVGHHVELRRAESAAANRRRQWAAELKAVATDADTANRLKSRFLASVSHELRTPMNAILGMAELLADSKLSDEQQDFAETIVGSARTLVAIVNNGLDLSQIEAGQLQLSKSSFDPLEQIENIIEMLSSKARRKGLELRLDASRDLPLRAIGDSLRISQVVTNLVNNALKFTDRGSVFLTASASFSAQDRFELKIEVSDTGRGISEEECERIFEPFYRVHDSGVSREPGTGLGLMIARQIAELMKGTITVESALGLGSTFTMTAVLEVDRSWRQPRQLPDSTRILVAARRESARVLDILAGFAARAELVAPNHQIIDKLNGAQRDQQPVHSIIVNWLDDAPAQQSIQAIFDWRQGQSSPLIIALVPFADTDSVRAARHHGADICVPVPIKRSRLLQALKRSVYLERAEQTTPIQNSSSKSASSLRVLVVDDAELNRKVTSKFLERWGHEFATANNGEEALQAIETGNYDVVLMDCEMPVLDGYQATQQLRSGTSPYRDIPVIAMTAHAMRGDRERCLAGGMTDYLCKPMDPNRLRTLLENIQQTSKTKVEEPLSQVLDEDRISQLRALDEQKPGLLDEILSLFADELLERSVDLSRALDRGDNKAVAQGAHRLRGSASNLGARRISETCYAIEHGAKRGILSDCEPLLGELSQYIEQAHSEIIYRLRRKRDSKSPGSCSLSSE